MKKPLIRWLSPTRQQLPRRRRRNLYQGQPKCFLLQFDSGCSRNNTESAAISRPASTKSRTIDNRSRSVWKEWLMAPGLCVRATIALMRVPDAKSVMFRVLIEVVSCKLQICMQELQNYGMNTRLNIRTKSLNTGANELESANAKKIENDDRDRS